MNRNVHTYGHYCLAARALEEVGERWTLLVVRDLLTGPKRFTDLMTTLGGITPSTLTQRLRALTERGLVTVERRTGQGSGVYRLTPEGAELGPVVDALTWWGLRNAWRPPEPDEPLHPEHLLRVAVQAIERVTDDHQPANWEFSFRREGDYFVESDGRHWSVRSNGYSSGPEIIVTATTESLLSFLKDPATEAPILIEGTPAAKRRFTELTRAFLLALGD